MNIDAADELTRKMKDTKLTKTPSKSRKYVNRVAAEADDDIFAFKDDELEPAKIQNKENRCKSPSRAARTATPPRTPSVSRRAAARGNTIKKIKEETKTLVDFREKSPGKRNASPSRTTKEKTPPRTPSTTRRAAAAREDTNHKSDTVTSIKAASSKIAPDFRKSPGKESSYSSRAPNVATPTRTPSVTRKAATHETTVKTLKDEAETLVNKDAAAKECKDILFNKMMAYLEEKILKYFEIMTEIQKEVYKEYTADEKFKFFQFTNMNVHVKVCNLLATKWARTDLKELYQKAFEFYLQKVFPASSTFSEKSKIKIAEYGRTLTAIAFVNGDYYLGLSCAVTVLELVPLDAYMFVLVAKWSCQLREFDVFDKYNNLPIKYGSEIEVIKTVCQLYSQFFKSILDTEKQLEIVDQVIVIKTELRNGKEKTFFGYLSLILINNLLGHSTKLPMFNIEKYGDMMKHFDDENHCAMIIATSRFKEFKNLYDKPPFIYDFDKLPDSQVFLKNTMAIPDFQDTEISYAKMMLQNGCVHECEKHLVSVLYNGTLLAAPFRVIQPLNALYYLKFRTLNDKDKLKAIGAMIALLLGKVSDIKNATEPYSRFRNDLLNDVYSFPAKSDSESVLNKTLATYVTTIPEHLPECDCFLCFEISTNGNMYAEKQYSILLIDGLSVEGCNEFSFNLAQNGNRKFKKRKAQLTEIALNIDEQNEKQKKAALSLHKYICEASTHCILTNKNIGEHSKEKICNNIINCSAFYVLDLRYYYLLGRQLKRKTYSLDAYFWLNKEEQIASSSNNELDAMFQCFDAFGIAKNGRRSPPKSPSREVLANQADFYKSQGKKGIGISGMTEKERENFDQARIDFKVYQHLLFSEWRRRICHYLGSYLAEDYPWYSAWYFLESRAISLRQYVRLRKTTTMEDLRFKDIAEFKAAVRALPNDITLVQLFVDEQNVLWVVRCGYNLIPIVLPLTKISVGKDDISRRMYNLLLENDQSVDGKVQKTKFWIIREQLNVKLEKLIADVEYKWLDKFRVLLMPFGKLNEKLQESVTAAKEILKNVGFSEERAKYLAILFLHAYKDDYKYLLSIFSFIERETFGNPINSSLQESIYGKLLKKCPANLFEKYLKEDRYTVLVVSPELSCYPWESLPLFSVNPFVLRIQSFHFFDRLTKKTKSPLPLKANSRNSYYMLNPSGDLKLTEKRIIDKIDLKKLEGVKGQYPSAEKILERLEKNNFFLYIGHGSGVRYVGASTIRRSICNAVAILMGCSSVRIEDEGHGFDGISAVNDYTIAGAPCTIGCLWMVTDGEIDRFLINFVERCFTEWSSEVTNSSVYKSIHENNGSIEVQYPYRLLIKAIVEARQACRLKTLTGGSVVVYGIPVFNDECNLKKFSSNNVDDSVIIIDD